MRARKERHSARARAVLLWGAALYLGGQLAAGLLLDYRWPLVRFPSARQLVAGLSVTQVKPDVVFLGSSRFQRLDALEVRTLLNRECRSRPALQVVNAAVPAGDPLTSEFVLRRLLGEGVDPRLVLLEVSPETLNRYNEWLGVHVRRQLRWDDAPGYVLDVFRSRQGMRWLGERSNPVYYHREAIWEEGLRAVTSLAAGAEQVNALRWSPGAIPDTPPDWGELLRLPTPTPAVPGRLDVPSDVRRWLHHYRVGGGNAVALDRLLGLCRDRGITVVLVGVPVTSGHRAVYTPEITREYLAHIESLTRKYHCPFMDYRERLPDNLFEDCHHLSREGGVYFSRLLTREVLAPFWRARLAQGTLAAATK